MLLSHAYKPTDRPQISKRSAKKVFAEVLNGEITLCDIADSVFFTDMEERLDILIDITRIFLNAGIAYKFLQQSRYVVQIKATFVGSVS